MPSVERACPRTDSQLLPRLLFDDLCTDEHGVVRLDRQPVSFHEGTQFLLGPQERCDRGWLGYRSYATPVSSFRAMEHAQYSSDVDKMVGFQQDHLGVRGALSAYRVFVRHCRSFGRGVFARRDEVSSAK